jgi:hypothetical protein
MRLAVLVIAFVLAIAAATEHARAAEDAPHNPVPAASRGVDIEIDDNDDDVLEVQVIVLGVVMGSVFVLGTAAWLLRRRLGLTAYTPPADDGHH